MSAPLSRFTPSLMPAALLERLFVARERHLAALMRRISAATKSTTRHHTLLVGPRGAGKTHLVALAYHRVRTLIEDGDRLQVSWLPEDPWTIVSYRHLLRAILDRIEPAAAGDIRSLSAAELEQQLVAKAAKDGPIVVILENLDQVLDQLGIDGQQQLRHLLQAERPIVLVATTTRLDRNLSDQARPFYGFFTTTRLEPFSVPEAADMLTAIALEAGDQSVADHLDTEQAKARLATIAHLAGGQPRIWAALGSALKLEQLDELVELLLTKFDDLTPYYQERLARLSPHGRLITAELAAADRPLHVSQLAQRLEIDQRSLAKTISILVDSGWIQPVTTPFADLMDKRRTYYELAEPLARLSFQLKESRGEPLRLVVDFLKVWFDPEQVARGSGESQSMAYLEVVSQEFATDSIGRVSRQLSRLPVTRAPAVELLGDVDDALAATMSGDVELYLGLPTTIRTVLDTRIQAAASVDEVLREIRHELHKSALDEMGNARHPTKDQWIERARGLVATSKKESASSRFLLIRWHASAWQFADAEAVLTATSAQVGPDHPDTLASRNNLANGYRSAGDLGRAVPLFEATLTDCERILGPDHPHTLTSRNNLAYTYQSAGDLGRAVPLYEATLTDCERILGPDHPNTLTSRNNLAGAYESAGDLGRAVPLYEATLTDRERILGPDHPHTLTSRNNLAGALKQSAH